jgi:hypothetical protein
MLLNIFVAVPLLLLGGYILWQTTHLFFGLYVAAWLGILTIGRYFVCRTCPYHGEDCPTYGWGHLARLMFRRDEGRGFNGPAAVIDFAAILVAALLPVIAWFVGLTGKVADFGTMEHILVAVFAASVVVALLVHQGTGCAKCELQECPFSGAARDMKARPVKYS